MVLLFSDFVECFNMTNNKTTKSQNYFYLLIFYSSSYVSWPARFGWKPIPSAARVTRDEVSGIRKVMGTVFQTAVPSCFINPETSSQVTLAQLGIVFQTKLFATYTHYLH